MRTLNASLQAKLLDKLDGIDFEKGKKERQATPRSITGLNFRFIKSCNLGKRSPQGDGGGKASKKQINDAGLGTK